MCGGAAVFVRVWEIFPSPRMQALPQSASPAQMAADKYAASHIAPDALMSICKHLTPRDRVALAGVCQSLRKVVTSDDCWRSLLSHIVADHAEPLYIQARRIASAPETAPFRRRCDDAAVTFFCPTKFCHCPLRKTICDFGGYERVRIAVRPGSSHVAHLPHGEDANEYWERRSSQSAPGLSVLRLRQASSVSVVSELRCLPVGDHLVAFNFRRPWIHPTLRCVPNFMLVCDVRDSGARLRKSIVCDFRNGTNCHNLSVAMANESGKLRMRKLLLDSNDSLDDWPDVAIMPRFSMWTRVEMSVSLEPGDVVVMSFVDTATTSKPGLEIGCCEAIICSGKKRDEEWQMFTTIDGGKTLEYIYGKS